jgi:hypothetical protein
MGPISTVAPDTLPEKGVLQVSANGGVGQSPKVAHELVAFQRPATQL